MFDLIADTPDFILVNKHPNVSVHKDDADEPWLTYIQAKLGIDKLYLVHRLDKMTSGLVVLAKHKEAAAALSQNFAKREVEKFYLALSIQKPKKKQGLICGDMQKSRRGMWKLLPSMQQPAVTQFFSKGAESGLRLFLCKPYTGKTHQIRVALNALGSAIFGDPLYANKQVSNPHFNADRGYLHAFAIRFSYQDKLYSYVLSPSELTDCGQLWQDPWVKKAILDWQEPWQLVWPKLSAAVVKAASNERN